MSAIAAMYKARQKTLRMVIEYHRENTIADEVAGTIRAAHTGAGNLSGADAIEEAKRVRAAALKSLTDMPPTVTDLLTRPPRIPANRSEAGQEPDHRPVAGPGAAEPSALRRWPTPP